MQTTKKRILGLGGLALITGLTVAAATVPAGATSVSSTVNIVVEVRSINYDTKINSPLDGAVVTQPIVKFSETHSRADSVKYYLTNVTTGQMYELTDHEISGTDLTGETEFTLNLDDYGGYGTFIFRSVIVSTESHIEDEDSVQFVYAAPESPNVPNTGSNSGIGAFYGALNISKSDILMTGLIGFLMISFVALFVIKKSSRKNR